MADHNYSLIIKNETDGNSSNPIAQNKGGTAQSKPANGSNTSASAATDAGASNAALKTLVAIKGIAVPLIDTVISHRISTVAVRTGAVEQQERLSFAYTIGKQVASIAMSTIAGAAVGNLPGALIGLATSVLTTAVSYGNKAEEINLQHSVEDVGLGFMNRRAGGSVATFSGSRLQRQ